MKNANQKTEISLPQRKSVINPIVDPLNVVVGHYGYEQTKPTKEEVKSSDYHTFRLHFILKGSVFYYNNGTEKLLEQNSCYLLSPQTDSSYKTNPKNPASIFWISFSGIDALALVELMGFSPADGALVFGAPYKKRLFTVLKDSFKALPEELLSVVLLKNFLQIVELLAECNSKQSDNDVHHRNSYIEQAVKYIQENYSNPSLSINDVSTYISVHRNYLSSLFKRNLGVTFTQYLTQKRMEQAIVLLKNSDYSVAGVAAMVGYTDQFYFSKLFKKYNTVSPSQYRKNSANPVQTEK